MAYKTFNKKTIYIDRDAKLFHHYGISMATACGMMMERIKIKKDATCLITGITGVGKSTLAGKFCFNYFSDMDNTRVEGDKMYTDDNFIIDPEDYAKRMIKDKGSVIWWDESRDGLSSKNWNKEINKTIVSRKNKNRKRGIVSLILLPHEGEVDKSFLKHITMWIWIKNRGIAYVFVAANPRMGGHGLSIPRIIERQDKWLKENPTRRAVPPTIHPEFIGTIAFGALSKEHEKRYDKMVDQHKATGELEDGEDEIDNTITKEDIEKLIPVLLDKVENDEIKTKRELWEIAKEETNLDDKKLIAYFNRHLKIRGFKNFNSFEF